jgi:hypothetical protein
MAASSERNISVEITASYPGSQRGSSTINLSLGSETKIADLGGRVRSELGKDPSIK